MHRVAHRSRDAADDFPLRHPLLFGCITLRTRFIRRSALVKVPSFSRNEVPGKEDMGEARRFVKEQILQDDDIHRA